MQGEALGWVEGVVAAGVDGVDGGEAGGGRAGGEEGLFVRVGEGEGEGAGDGGCGGGEGVGGCAGEEVGEGGVESFFDKAEGAVFVGVGDLRWAGGVAG